MWVQRDLGADELGLRRDLVDHRPHHGRVGSPLTSGRLLAGEVYIAVREDGRRGDCHEVLDGRLEEAGVADWDLLELRHLTGRELGVEMGLLGGWDGALKTRLYSGDEYGILEQTHSSASFHRTRSTSLDLWLIGSYSLLRLGRSHIRLDSALNRD